MKLYAFQLGRNKDLSTAELLSIFGSENFIERNPDTAIFQLDTLDQLKAQNLQNTLGGTIKIIEILCNLDTNSPKEKVHRKLQGVLEKNFANNTKRLNFSISIFGYRKSNSTNIKETLNFSKKILKNLKINSYFLNKNHKNAKPSTIFQAKIVKKGIDLNLIYGEKHLYVGKTIAIQNISAYTIRDYKKPIRDAKNGMLPPKLAQIMINLAGDTKNIYDPFCGVGTVPMEALLMNKNTVGSDLNPKMAEASEKNLYWTSRKFQTQANYRIFQRDAQFLNKTVIPEQIDAIVTEGYLGPALEKPPTASEREKHFRNLANLHLNWLSSANQLLKPGQKIVTCITAYQDKEQIHHLPKISQLVKTAGFHIKKHFTYSRPEQIVARDIYILQKN